MKRQSMQSKRARCNICMEVDEIHSNIGLQLFVLPTLETPGVSLHIQVASLAAVPKPGLD